MFMTSVAAPTHKLSIIWIYSREVNWADKTWRMSERIFVPEVSSILVDSKTHSNFDNWFDGSHEATQPEGMWESVCLFSHYVLTGLWWDGSLLFLSRLSSWFRKTGYEDTEHAHNWACNKAKHKHHAVDADRDKRSERLEHKSLLLLET